MRRNYISNSLFMVALIAFMSIIKFTGYFSAAFLKDDFFYGAIVLPIAIGFSIFAIVWVLLGCKNKKWVNTLTIVTSFITTAAIIVMVSVLPWIYLLMSDGLQIVILSIPLSLILFNVWMVEWSIHKTKNS